MIAYASQWLKLNDNCIKPNGFLIQPNRYILFVPANVGNFPAKSKVVDNLSSSRGDALHNVVHVAL